MRNGWKNYKYNMENYKQKISNTNHFDNIVTISLTRDEWNSSCTWCESMLRRSCERLSKEWFEDLHWMVMYPINKEVNFSDRNYKYGVDISFDIPRVLLRMFVYSIGRIAYDFDVKGITSVSAQVIIDKINKQIKNQLPSSDQWFIDGF